MIDDELMPTTPESKSSSIAAYINGKMYTADSDKTWAEATLVYNGKFLAVGSDEDILTLSNEAALIELNNRMINPDIHDAHIHLLHTGIKLRAKCGLRESAQAKNIVEELNDCEGNINGRSSGWIVVGV